MTNVAADRHLPTYLRLGETVLRRRVAVMSALFLVLPIYLVFAVKGLTLWLALTLCAPAPLSMWPQAATWRAGNLIRALFFVFAWALAALTWSPVNGRNTLVGVFFLCLVGAHWVLTVDTLTAKERSQVIARVIVGVVIALFLLSVESFTSLRLGMRLTGVTSGADRLTDIGASMSTLALVMLVPMAVIARDELRAHNIPFPIVTCTLVFVFLANAVVLHAVAALAAALVATLAFLSVYWYRRVGLTAIGLVTVGYLLLAPTIHVWPIANDAKLADDWGARREAWRNVSLQIYDSMLIGHGFASGETLGRAQDAVAGGNDIARRSHNVFLQIWYEFGLVGAVIFSILIVAILSSVARSSFDRVERAMAAAIFVAFLTGSLVSFGLWQMWWLAALWLAVGTLGLLKDPADEAADDAITA